jgi:hypothetical protein
MVLEIVLRVRPGISTSINSPLTRTLSYVPTQLQRSLKLSIVPNSKRKNDLVNTEQSLPQLTLLITQFWVHCCLYSQGRQSKVLASSKFTM